MTISNLFTLPDALPSEELFEVLLQGNHVKVERIISSGQVTPPEQWYDQQQDEWVIVLQGKAILTLWDREATISLEAGDYLLISAHQRHRVEYTSRKPPCIWLAIHGQFS
ncbi:MAG: cupin domain-containing protein [Microcoleaceae cyanobacterium]